MTEKQSEEILNVRDKVEIVAERLALYEKRDIGLLTVLDQEYPKLLLKTDYPPPMLYYQGDLGILKRDSVAVVGSHEASTDAVNEAVRLGQEISAAGTAVVSGLARGVDSGAHVGAIQGEGSTIAVLGCGFDEVYPAENQTLAETIRASGLLLSEYRPETAVSVGRLHARNRIIVGLARSIIVVEITSDVGGTSDAIREAGKQGKSLFTCFDPNSEGASTNKLGAIHLKAEDDWKMVLEYMV
jgi:DNA processing protein